jgi:hypothetical protein
MVDPVLDKRDQPVYDLARIRELAGKGLVVAAGSKVENDAQNLGYDPDALNGCISSLQAEEFDHAVRYPGEKFWQDVYKIRRESPQGAIDDLYVKLKLTRNWVTVVLHSFHRHR